MSRLSFLIVGTLLLLQLSSARLNANSTISNDEASDEASVFFTNETVLQGPSVVFVRESDVTSKSLTGWGGIGGKDFRRVSIGRGTRIQLRYARLVDAIILNGQRYGGVGGVLSDEIILGQGEYINAVGVRSGGYVDFLSFSTNKGKLLFGGGCGGYHSSLQQIRVTGIAGKRGGVLDRIIIYYI